jgi:hypothetical protein
MCRCRRSHDVNVEVSEDVVAVVEIFMVDVLLLIVRRSRERRRHKKLRNMYHGAAIDDVLHI